MTEQITRNAHAVVTGAGSGIGRAFALELAARSGRVVFSGRRGDYGLLVILEHDEGFSSWYAHNSRVLVESGQRVREGEVIAKSGRTGRASGTHLHFEIRHRGKPLDPLTFLP